MINQITLFLTFIILSTAQLAAQEILTTKSGQKIQFQADGSYTLLTQESEITGDTSEATSENVFETPQETGVTLTPTQTADIANLSDILMNKEVELFVAKRTLKSEIEKKEAKMKTLSATQQKGYAKLISRDKKELKATHKKYQCANDLLAKVNSYKTKKQSNIDRKLIAVHKKVKKEFDLAAPATQQVAAQKIEDRGGSYPTRFPTENTRRAKSNQDCTIAFDGKDSATGKSKKEVQAGQLYTFTQPKLKPYFKEDDFMTCDAHLTKLGKDHYITLNIRLKSKDASKSYGSLNTGDEMRIEFIDGRQLILKNIVQDYGEIEAYSGHTLYSAIYPLSKDDVNDLEDRLLDNIGILWSSGFEQYDIYEVDFFINQVNCLKNGKYQK